MKKKGFTLIELLAVIVVLAIIAVIATPMVINTIEESRQGAAMASATSYVKAIETKVASDLMENKVYEDKDDYAYDEIQIDIKGTNPTGGLYSLKDGVVTAGTFCINGYEVKYQNNKTEIQGKCTGEDLKLSGSVKLSQSSGYHEHPISGTFEITENLSGGKLSCTSSDEEVATCSISGTTVTVTPGKKEGVADLTIKSEGSSKYKEAQAVYVVTTKKGLLSYTANGYNGTYDGEGHGITVTSSGSTIKYGTSEGNYTLDVSPTYTDVGEYTVYYEITREGYNTVTGSNQVIISKTTGSLSLSATSGTVVYGSDNTFTVSDNTGELSVKSADTNIATASVSGTTVTVTGVKEGSTTITVTSEPSTNYNAASKTYTISVTPTTTEPTVTQSGSDARSLVVTNKQANSSSGLTETTLSYGYSTSENGTYTWQTSNTFGSLEAGTTYYFKTKLTNSSGVETISNYTTGRIEYTGIAAGTYSAGQEVTYAGTDWQVIKDNGNNVTLIKSSNISTGIYGKTTEYSTSDAKTKIDEWVNNNSILVSDKNVQALVADSSTGYYARLPRISEVSGKIKNASETPFWTMTKSSLSSESHVFIADKYGKSNKGVVNINNYTRLYTQVSNASEMTYLGVSLYSNSQMETNYPWHVGMPSVHMVSYAPILAGTNYYSRNYEKNSSGGYYNICVSAIGVSNVYLYTGTWYAVGDSSCVNSYEGYYAISYDGGGQIGYRPVITVMEK